MIALLDIDSLFYLACYKLDTPESVDALGLSNEDADGIVFGLAQKAEERLWDMWAGIQYDIEQDENNIKIDSIEIYVTKCTESIRKNLSPQYKANRDRNEIVDCLRNMFIFNSDAISHDSLEADDLIADRARELGEDNCLIVSMDKDLQQIGGFIYNFYRKPSIKDEYGSPIETFPRKGLSYISKLEAMKFLAKQMIMGDAGDGVQGLPKYGKAKADKIIDPIECKFGLIKAVVNEYKTVYGEDYSEPLMLNFRLLFLGKM
jgi:hypothetical protein